ncbi:MAG TPA: lipoprotein LipL21 [Leptospiraceae bacterium]|nr:lipoprotein LipL21 [Leptospiraceae bacterium]HMZ59789.1 lipoprotein LipL21 [Leptospiraceae bacterium]HNF17547.1 lipoprotein LipL21 [Leptospiraceae bacterium]HNF27226.1 lipoprotein LipL21 [Leptospiraceae bacterium]HNI28163.1 lipoprotein LipL21 [Leptospiraceae bacterium]
MKSKSLGLLFTAIILFGIGCGTSADKDPTTVGSDGKVFEGWAGPPEDTKKKPLEYYYMKRVSRASVKANDKRSGAMMQETCTSSAALTAKADFMRKVIGESLQGAEGVSDGESTGKVVVAEFNGKVKGLNTRECKPLKEKQPEVPGIEWEECECVIFAKVPGGKDAIVAKAQEVEGSRKK